MDADDAVANLMAITGADEPQAVLMLEATGYSLQDAVDLFFAAGGDLGGGAAPAAPLAAPHEPEDDEALARRLDQ